MMKLLNKKEIRLTNGATCWCKFHNGNIVESSLLKEGKVYEFESHCGYFCCKKYYDLSGGQVAFGFTTDKSLKSWRTCVFLYKFYYKKGIVAF